MWFLESQQPGAAIPSRLHALGIQPPASRAFCIFWLLPARLLRGDGIERRNSLKENALLTEVTKALRQQCQAQCAEGSVPRALWPDGACEDRRLLSLFCQGSQAVFAPDSKQPKKPGCRSASSLFQKPSLFAESEGAPLSKLLLGRVPRPFLLSSMPFLPSLREGHCLRFHVLLEERLITHQAESHRLC